MLQKYMLSPLIVCSSEVTMSTKVSFGVSLPQQRVDFDTVKEVALICEKLGYDSIWCYDHFFPYDGSDRQQSFFECLSTLSALSVITKKIRLGSLVLCNEFRNPALVSKITSQIDVMSKGRLILGIGAGWFKEEFDTYGYPFSDVKTRIERLEEAIQIIKLMWTKDVVNFSGKHYKIKGAINEPKPIQKPHPPIWIGGSLERILKIAAKYADGWNLGFYASNTPEGFSKKSKKLDELCLLFGRKPSALRRSWHGLVVLADNRSVLFDKLRKYSWMAMGSTLIASTYEECEQSFKKYIEAGVTDFVIKFAEVPESLDVLEKFSQIMLH
ncbi:hypothetical protein B9Q02_11855 [Candidatus Marsarchaeota G1 archaeon BE_D]|jgi:alkanesulfonate monooxygenase SsuD/methylene tetrahydromethanopterin reductase-like flavin-dependent oxidoreductase (luciferase family)|uniref:Luciferase-like domain-containing protein n=1 Tax=Candidatus Marsarchaeota G1 archaeon BE_D TaxID=1978156 RepID=A0A2R6A7C6_9ARCH|nr:MAG: hypothetical protein B9Q02_11855 [Candidatus Marsarchaeota G1 archaeon BE_D]